MENKSDKRLMILEASERSEEVSKIAVERTEPEKVLPRPDPEVPAKATRRRFSARYKLRILEQADGCESGEGDFQIWILCQVSNPRPRTMSATTALQVRMDMGISERRMIPAFSGRPAIPGS